MAKITPNSSSTIILRNYIIDNNSNTINTVAPRYKYNALRYRVDLVRTFYFLANISFFTVFLMFRKILNFEIKLNFMLSYFVI